MDPLFECSTTRNTNLKVRIVKVKDSKSSGKRQEYYGLEYEESRYISSDGQRAWVPIKEEGWEVLARRLAEKFLLSVKKTLTTEQALKKYGQPYPLKSKVLKIN